jgi:hypothetical protein
MSKTGTLDFARLLGFEAVRAEMERPLDFQDETLGDKLGAKMGLDGTEPTAPAELSVEVGDGGEASGCTQLFLDETFADKLGAKVGLEPF